MHLHPLISDLALLLLLAAGATLLFKKLKQPLVLGYIVAGFLANGTISFFPAVSDSGTIKIWAEIGIIFLLFSLGLEFSFKKLFKVGSSALITALVVVAGMMSCGFAVGQMLGWSQLDSIFLGAMLSMSSTTIIIKAFDDLGIKQQRFTSIVFGILIVEDLFAILLLVFLSTLGRSSSFDGGELFDSVFNLVFFLLLWFIVGLYFIPMILRKVKKYANNEVLLILALGMCMGMVVLANYVGFSSALGAFVMGSILAETIEAEQIERLTRPVKHLFGAIFFVSVGMMVQPALLAQYWLPILIITTVVIIGQILFVGSGLLVSGQPLKTAVQSSMSLAQIGEFAFIIATLGSSMHITSDFLYPIAVAVSIITTFTTPFFIGSSEKAYGVIERKLPNKFRFILNRLGEHQQMTSSPSDWQIYRKKYWIFVSIQTTLIIGLIMTSKQYLFPLLQKGFSGYHSNLISTLITFVAILPFLWSLIFRKINSRCYSALWNDSRFNHAILVGMRILRIVIALSLLSYLLTSVLHYSHGIILLCVIVLLSLGLFSKKIKFGIESFEKQLKFHLTAREKHTERSIRNLISNIQIASFTISPNSELVGKYLYKADFRKSYGVSIVSIKRGNKLLFIPGAKDQIFPYDSVTVVGSDEDLIKFGKAVEIELLGGEYIEVTHPTEITLKPFSLSEGSTIISKPLKEIDFKPIAIVMIVGVERNGEALFIPDGETILYAEDLLWVVGQDHELEKFSELT